MKELIIIGILFLCSSCDFFKIDRCLDQGGSWNYETRECEFSEEDINSNASKPDLIGTVWYCSGYQGLQGDSLVFNSDSEVRYYIGELTWSFDSKYELKKDTLTIKTVSAALEVDNIAGLDPDLVQKYVINERSMRLVYQANYSNNKWVKLSEAQIEKPTEFQRLK